MSILLTAMLLSARCQNTSSQWHFGNFSGLNFMTNPPTPFLSNMSTVEGCASVANSAGSLLFYTDGSTVWNQIGTVMGNGTGMGGNASTTQAAVIIKQPGNSNIYYIFSLDLWTNASTLSYSTVDMNLAAGLGSVTLNGSIISSPNTEKLTAVKHCNGVDFWVLCPAVQGTLNVLNAYLVSAAGVNTVPVVSAIGNTGFAGNLKSSPNGRQLAFACLFTSNCKLCDFDNATGIASNVLTFNSFIASCYGVEFSPDGTKLYATSLNVPSVYQWNLCAGNAAAIEASVYSFSVPTPIAGMQMAGDGKIYIAKPAQADVAVINNPNSLGSTSNYLHNTSLNASNGSCNYNLPNFIASDFFNQPSFTYSINNIYGCNTAAFNTTILPMYQQNACSASGSSSLLWNFGDPSSGAANTSTLTNPLHSFSGLGTYTVTLIMYNSNPCGGVNDTITQLLNINAFCVSVLSQSISCASLGSATATSVNGGGPFSYTWMPSGQTSSVATGLNPGTHTVYVYDQLTGLSYSSTTTFTSATPYTGTLSNSPNQPCGGVNTGTANILLSGGSGNQNYLWTGPLGIQTGSVATGLSAGNYTVTVTDALTSCSVSQTFTMGPAPVPLGLFVTSSSSSLCVGSQASFTASGYGGNPIIPIAYTYTWTGGPQTNSYNALPLTAGNLLYTVTITDANSCTLSATYPITVVPNPALVVSNVSVCPQQTATLTASGVTTYTWNTGSTSSSISNVPLATTAYTVTGSALGCTAIATASIVVNSNPTPTVTSNNPVCSTKTLNLYASGGNTYSWSGPTFFSSSFQNPEINSAGLVNSGVYNVTVTSANSCTASAAITVSIYPTPTLSTIGATVCTTQSISLLANAVGALTYAWSGPGGYSSFTADSIIVTPSTSMSGIYTLVVNSIDGCINTAQVNVTVSALPQPTFTTNSPKCEGSTLSFNSTGSSGGSVYYWTGPNGFTSSLANPFISNLSPAASGVYTLSMIEGPCSSTVSQTAIVYPNPTPVINHNAPVCETKTFTATVNTVYPVYQWNGPLSFSTANQGFTISNTATYQSGVYTAIVTDSNNCQGQATASITIMPKPDLSVLGANVCYGQAALISASGANTYSWSGPGGFFAFTAQATIPSALNTSPSTYYVIGQSANSCTSIASVQVSTKALPKAMANLSPRGCVNSPIHFAGEGGIAYNWTGPLGFTQSQQNFSVLVNNVGMVGEYTLTVTDAQGCKDYATATLLVDPAPQGNLWKNNTQNCVPFCSDFKFLPVDAPIVSSSWLVNGQNFESEIFNYCFTQAGDYTLRGDFTDSRSCKSSVVFVINAYPVPKADFSYFPQEPVEGSEVQFESTSDGSELKSYSWYFSTNQLVGANQTRLDHTFPDQGVHPVAMVVKNKWGCEDTVVKAITVSEDFYLYVPNAFTPNQDNLNETFKAVTRGVKTFNMMIHNRWGQLIYQSNELSPGWDGSFKGEPCKEDVYTWQINATSAKGKEKKLSGSVLLYR